MVASGLGTGTGTVGLLLTGPVKAALDRQSLSEAKCFHFSLGWTPGAVILGCHGQIVFQERFLLHSVGLL